MNERGVGQPAPRSARHEGVKRLRRLFRSASARRDEAVFLVEGASLIAEAARDGVVFDELWVEAGFADEVAPFAPDAFLELEPGVLASLSTTTTPRPSVAIARRPLHDDTVFDASGAVAVIGLSDPGNVGALIRSAEAAGCCAVFVLSGCADPWSPKAYRGGAGATARLPIMSASEASLDRALQGRTVVALDAQATESLWDVPIDGRFAVVLGHERHGIPSELMPFVSKHVAIPMHGPTESLNASVAGSLALFRLGGHGV